MIRVTIEKSTGKVIHEENGVKTEITGITKGCCIKEIETQMKTQNLECCN